MSETNPIDWLSPCATCGELVGSVPYRVVGLPWRRLLELEGKEPHVQVGCPCSGIDCPGCGRRLHRPGTSWYDPVSGALREESPWSQYGCRECSWLLHRFRDGGRTRAEAGPAARAPAPWPRVVRPWVSGASWDRRRLVYGYDFLGLAFVDELEALHRAALWGVLQTARTWGEFQARVHPREHDFVLGEIRRHYRIDDEAVRAFAEKHAISPHEATQELYWLPCGFPPDPKSPFDPYVIPGHDNARYPTRPASDMYDWLPDEIREEFGKPGDMSPMFDLETMYLDPAREEEVVAAFARLGIACRPDQTLAVACGAVTVV